MSGFQSDIAGGGGDLIATSVQNPDFVSGSAGWQIRKDGSAEFNNVTIRGGLIEGAPGLYYNGAPALGNLIVSIADAANTDGVGNAYLAGVTNYFNLTAVNINHGVITAYSAPGAAGPWTAAGGRLTLTALAVLAGVTVTVEGPLVLPLVAVQPGTLTTAETWHAITLDAGWTATVTPEYRMLPDGNVQVRGQASHAGITAATNINSGIPIPSGYWPAANRVYRPPDSCDSAGPVQISTAGVFAMRSTVTNGFTATQVIFDGIYSI